MFSRSREANHCWSGLIAIAIMGEACCEGKTNGMNQNTQKTINWVGFEGEIYI